MYTKQGEGEGLDLLSLRSGTYLLFDSGGDLPDFVLRVPHVSNSIGNERYARLMERGMGLMLAPTLLPASNS